MHMADDVTLSNAIAASFVSHSLYDLGVRLIGDFHADNAIIISIGFPMHPFQALDCRFAIHTRSPSLAGMCVCYGGGEIHYTTSVGMI
jgi:hypothetical protein